MAPVKVGLTENLLILPAALTNAFCCCDQVHVFFEGKIQQNENENKNLIIKQ